MKGMKIYEILFNPIVIKSVSKLANGNTNMIIHGGGQKQCCSPKGSWDGCAMSLLRALNINWT